MTEIEQAKRDGYVQAMDDALIAADKLKHIPPGCKAQICNFRTLRKTLQQMKDDRLCQQ